MRWLRCSEAAQYAGGVSEKLVYRAVRERKLRVARIGSGRNWLTCEEWVDGWLLGDSVGRKKAGEETK